MKPVIEKAKPAPANDQQTKPQQATATLPSAPAKPPTPGPKSGHGIGMPIGLAPANLGLPRRSRGELSLRNSELRYRRLFEAAQDGILILDAETGAITDVNPYLIDKLGYSREEFVGKKIWQVGAFRDTKASKDEFAELKREEYVRYDDLPLKAKDGRLIQVEFVSNVYQENHHNVIQCNIRDISERKRADEALRESEARLDLALRSAGMGAWHWDAIENKRYLDDQACHLLGINPTTFTGTEEEFFGAVHPDDRETIKAALARSIEQDVSYEPEYRAVWPDGSVHHITARGRLVRDDKGRPLRINGIVWDITERKRAEEALRDSESSLQGILRSTADGILAVSRENKTLFANERFVEMWRIPAAVVATEDDHVILQHVLDQLSDPQGFLKKVQALYKSDAESFDTLYFKDGRVFERLSRPLMQEAELRGRVWSFRDITERKQAEARQNAVYQIAQASELAESLADLFPQIHRIISGVMPAENLYIALYDQARNRLSFPYSVDEVDKTYSGEEIEPGRGLTAYVLRTAKSLLCTESIHEKLVQQGEIEQIGVLSRIWLGVPLIVHSRVIGVMVVQHYSNPHAYGEREQRVLEFVSSQVALAIDRKQAVEQVRQRLSEMEAIHTVSTALRAAQTRDEALPILLDETLNALETDAGAIWLYHADTGKLHAAVTRGWYRQLSQISIRPGEGVAGTVFTSGQMRVSAEFVHNPLVRQPAIGEIPAGWGGICLPVRTGAITAGVMFVAVPPPRQVTAEQVKLLESLTGIAGTTLHRMTLYEDTVRQLDFLEALHNIDAAISASMDLQLTLDILLQHVKTQLNVDATDVLILNPHSPVLEYAAGRGFRTRGVQTARIRLGESYAGRAALDRRPVQEDDLSRTHENPQFAAFWAGEGFAAYYGMPLIAKGEVKGVLEVYHRATFHPDSDWISFLEALAGQAAIAIDGAQVFRHLQDSNADLQHAYDATIEGWSRALDLRDRETEGHTQRVTEVAVRLAAAMGISVAELDHVRRGALLHDIGKMGVPDSILLKPGPLTDAEWVIMRKHPQMAFDLLSPITYLRPALDIPYCHHEKWDGTGYPRGLKGEHIPLIARIFAVVDVWDALRSDRPYRPA